MYPADLQKYIDAERGNEEQFFATLSLTDYTAYTWAYISYFFDRLDQSSLTAAEDHKFAPQIHHTITRYYEGLCHESAEEYAHPRRIAKFYTIKIVEYRQETLPYYVMPDLSILNDDTAQKPQQMSENRKAFWLGWGL